MHGPDFHPAAQYEGFVPFAHTHSPRVEGACRQLPPLPRRDWRGCGDAFAVLRIVWQQVEVPCWSSKELLYRLLADSNEFSFKLLADSNGPVKKDCSLHSVGREVGDENVFEIRRSAWPTFKSNFTLWNKLTGEIPTLGPWIPGFPLHSCWVSHPVGRCSPLSVPPCGAVFTVKCPTPLGGVHRRKQKEN